MDIIYSREEYLRTQAEPMCYSAGHPEHIEESTLTSRMESKDRRISEFTIRQGTNIGSGATPAFEPRLVVPAHVTADTSYPQHPVTPSDMINTHPVNALPSIYNQESPGDYRSPSMPGQPNFNSNLFTPRHVPDGTLQDFAYQQHQYGMPFVDPAYASPQSGFHISQQGTGPGVHVNGRMPYGNRPPSQQTPSRRYPAHFPKNHGAPTAPKSKVNQLAEGSHTNSRTWTSQEQQEMQRFNTVSANLKRTEVNPRSPFVPKSFDEWLSLRAGQAEDRKHDAERRISFKEKNKGHKVKISPPFGGKQYNDGKGAVLGKPTIWHEPFDACKMDRPVADWPCVEEMREEGDQRNTSKLGRHLAFPRVPSDTPMYYKTKRYLKATEMDETWQVPTADTYEAMMTADLEEVMRRQEEYLGEEFMKELDCDHRGD